MTVATISSKGWIVIPNELRRKYHLRAGDKVRAGGLRRVLSIVPAMADPVEEAAAR